MKEIVSGLINFAALFALGYVFISFVTLNADFRAWPDFVRFLLFLIPAMISIAIYANKTTDL